MFDPADQPTDYTADIDNANRNDLRLLRGLAIEVYASVEHSLCSLMSRLTGMTPEITGIIFFKITSADVRDKIIERLLKVKKGDEFNPFWNSVQKMLKDLANKRNNIVHWSAIHEEKSDGTTSTWLTPGPSIFTFDWDTTTFKPSEVVEFSYKCNFLSALINIFADMLGGIRGQVPETLWLKWNAIIREPVMYPPSETHPLYKYYKKA